MEKVSISKILSATGGTLLSGNTDDFITSVSIDSRKVTKGCLFVPLKGEKRDGHDFIKDAFKFGASVSLCEVGNNKIKGIYGSLIEVNNTLIALQQLAAYYRSKFSIPIIGVTGSVGKTTTKEMIASVLGENLKVLKTKGNYNGQIGLPLTIFELDSSYQAAVLEMGISKPGEMDRLNKIANPNIGVITNIGLSHIENFESLENTKDEKIKIVSGENKKLYVNGDSPLLTNIENKSKALITYFGINGAYPYKCQEIYNNEEKTGFVLSTFQLRENIIIPCLGLHNVYNALAAIAVSRDMGMHLEDIKRGLLNFRNADRRQNILKLKNLTLIDDSYNASPDSIKSSVSILKNIKSIGKNIVVIADILELGDRSKEIHFETGRYIAMEKIDVLITIGKDSKYLSDGAKCVNQDIITKHCSDNIEAFRKIKEMISAQDKILIKGSRGMHTDQIVELIINEYNRA